MNADRESAPEPLDAWHERRGARWRTVAGRRTVAGYGDAASEAAALLDGCGLAESRWTATLVVAGEDRRRFLNGYLTCDVAALEPGDGTYGFFTSAQGRILADAVVGAAAEELRVEVPRTRRQSLLEHLGRYVLTERVEVAPAPQRVQWLLAGPGAPALAERLAGALPPMVWGRCSGRIADRQVDLVRERDIGVPVVRLVAAAADAAEVSEALVAAGAAPVGFDALDRLRVEAGVPRYGSEFDDANFPQETGLEDAVSYTKGCYLGQEVVARIHYRGHVNHLLRALAIDGERAPEAGGEIRLGEERVGRLGSAVVSPRAGGPIGLAVLHRKAAAPGTRVTLAGGVGMRVEEPGFAVTAAGRV